MRRFVGPLAALLVLAAPARSQDANVTEPVPELEKMLATEPFRIVSAEVSRPKAKGDITLKAEVAFSDREPMRVKVRKADYHYRNVGTPDDLDAWVAGLMSRLSQAKPEKD